MGWGGGKFPVISQLNVLTAPGRIQDTQQFFIGKYGLQGENYHLGDLCFDWEAAIVPAPPWAEDEDNPRKDADARD